METYECALPIEQGENIEPIEIEIEEIEEREEFGATCCGAGCICG